MNISRLRAIFGTQLVTEPETLRELSTDFGRLVQRTPAALIGPRRPEDIRQLIQIANEEGWTVATRGSGHSQSGQSLSQGGVLLDMSALKGIDRIEKDCVWVRSGVTWAELVDELLPFGYIPPVLTNNLNVTVGGTLSVAGLGVASHRHGTQADNVAALEVVTGSGEMVECSPSQNSDLFDCVRCGLGQFAVITRVRLKLRRCLSRVRTYYLLYDDIKALMEDQTRILGGGHFDYVEGWCTSCAQGLRKVGEAKVPFAEWFYPVHLTIEYDDRAPSDSELSRLQFYRKVHVEDSSLREFLYRLEPVFELWREGGAWNLPHPWMEVVLPWEAAAGYIRGVLANFPPNLLAGGHVLLWPCRGNVTHAPMFMHPPGDFVMGFGILAAVPRPFLNMAISLLHRASVLAMQVGGRRYLSGWVDFDEKQWQTHFGESWSQICQWKEFYDPNEVLNPGFIRYPK